MTSPVQTLRATQAGQQVSSQCLEARTEKAHEGGMGGKKETPLRSQGPRACPPLVAATATAVPAATAAPAAVEALAEEQQLYQQQLRQQQQQQLCLQQQQLKRDR